MADIQAAADGIIAAAAHPVAVQVINQGPGIWGNVATGLITAGAAIAGILLTHHFTLRRERLAAEDKLQKEKHFIATELIFMLEQFAERCAQVAVDTGVNEHQHRVFSIASPQFNIENVSGDWRALPPLLMYRIRQLPVLQSEAEDTIAYIKARDPAFQKFNTFQERYYQYARLGLKAAILAIKLRACANLPASRIRENAWSPFRILRTVWKQERKRKSQKFRDRQRDLVVLAIKNDVRNKAPDNGAGSGENA
ncbi:MAG: hypothetical protein E6X99_23725 [Pantoea sp.]|nr:hypothetical protein [Pantoea sp.]